MPNPVEDSEISAQVTETSETGVLVLKNNRRNVWSN